MNDRIGMNFGPDGYRIFRQVVPKEQLNSAIDAIALHAGVDPGDPKSWVRLPKENVGIIPLHHAQAFWDNRQHPEVHAAFSHVYGADKLWVTMDRALFRPPLTQEERAERSAGWYLGFADIHWDVDPRQPHPGWAHGVLLLSDTPPNAGGFHCVPEIYRDLNQWLRTHPEADWRAPDIESHYVLHVTGEAGDLIVWDPFLPHGASRNFGTRPRIAQYISMAPLPSLLSRHAERRRRIRLFTEKRAPEIWRGMIGQHDPEPGPPVVLTPLGRKLVGFESW